MKLSAKKIGLFIILSLTLPAIICYASASDLNLKEYSSYKGEGAAYILKDQNSQSDLRIGIVEVNEISYNVDGLAPGIYQFRILVNDTSGNEASDIVNIVVLPQDAANFEMVIIILIISGGIICIIAIVIVKKRG